MYKNQLQELAQRSCFNLPSYSCIREGPDHAPRFKATVNFNGETFDSPTFCSTLRQAEHAAAEVALTTLADRGPSRALAARVLDETGVYKNLLQETAHRAGLNLPVYTTMRSGPGHVPVFSCTVELAGMGFSGELARTKKQAQKNAAMAAWLALKRSISCKFSISSMITDSTMAKLSPWTDIFYVPCAVSQSSLSSPSSSSSSETRSSEEQEQVVIARLLASLCQSESKQHAQNDCQHEKQRFIPVCRDLTPPTASSRVIHGQSWPYPTLSPEMALYHMWQQEQLLQLQNHLYTLPLSPFPVPSPRILCQSIFHPGHGLSVPEMEQRPVTTGSRLKIANSGPALYFSDNSVHKPMGGRSSLTIQEIHEEKAEESSKFLPPVVLGSPVSGHPTLEASNEVSSLDESKQKVDSNGPLEKAEQEETHSGKSEQACHRRPGAGSRSSLDGRLQNLLSRDAYQSYLRPQYPATAYSCQDSGSPSAAAAPVTIRTICPVSTVRPRLQNLPIQGVVPPRMRTGEPSLTRPRYERVNLGVVRPSSMAPAVRIRSVVPVCSAPPPREVQNVGEGNLPHVESKSTESGAESIASLEFNKLKIYR